MNIEEANDNLIMLKYFLQEEGDEDWKKYCEAIILQNIKIIKAGMNVLIFKN